jgi:hypothetical protein
MPLFRRRAAESDPVVFTVGVGDHRVVVGGEPAGCALLEDVDQYAAFIARRSGQRDGDRDSVGVLNAKLDYAELVDTMVSVLVLTFEELTERGVMAAGEVPAKPAASPLQRDLATYDYIQQSYERALDRVEWARRVDAQLRDHGIAVLWPQT